MPLENDQLFQKLLAMVVPFAELAILVGLPAFLAAFLHIPVPLIDQRHVLPGTHGLMDLLKIRESKLRIPLM